MNNNKDTLSKSVFKGKDSATMGNYTADIITHCLTNDCRDCLGSYTNEILSHCFICRCKRCRHGEAGDPGIPGTQEDRKPRI